MDAGETSALAAPAAAGFELLAGPLDVAEDGKSFSVVLEPRHLNGGDRLHGGMMMAMASMVLGAAARELAGDRRTEPLSLNCDFVSAGLPGDKVVATAQVTRKTRTVLFLSGRLMVDDRVLMTATGVWKVSDEATA